MKYCFSRVWQFHFKLEKQFHSSSQNIFASGTPLAQIEAQLTFENIEPVMLCFEISKKIYPLEHIGGNSDDIYPAIEIIPNSESRSLLNDLLKNFLNKQENFNNGEINTFDSIISHIQFRITDYGFLNLYTIFEDDKIEIAINKQFEITRWLTDITIGLDDLFLKMQLNGLIRLSSHKFGIPISFENIINIDKSFSFLYQGHLFVQSSDTKNINKYIKEFHGKSPDENFQYDLTEQLFKILGIQDAPIWVFNDLPKNLEIPYYTEADNRVLIELNTMNSAGFLFTELAMVLSNPEALTKKEKKKLKNASHILRKISVNYSWVLQTMRIRYTELDSWQRNYENKLKLDALHIAESREIYKESEGMISKIIETLDVRSDRRYQKRIESFFLIFAGITLGSTYVDIITFIEEKPSNFQNVNLHFIEIKILFFIILAVLTAIIIASRRNK